MNNALLFFAFSVSLGTASIGQAQLASGTASRIAPAVVTPNLSTLEGINPFDEQRATWPDRIPAPPPPPPPAPPAPVVDQDLQLYGTVLVGGQRLATVKVGKRFAALAPEGREFATLRQGQMLGEFSIAAIQMDSIVLQAAGGQQRLYFTPKTDRAAGAKPSVVATAPVQGSSNPGADAQHPAPAETPAPTQGTPAPTGSTQPTGLGQAGAPTTTAAPFNLRSSLAAALEAARNNNQQPSPPPGNPAANNNPFQK